MAFPFTKLSADNGFKFLLCRIFLLWVTTLTGLGGRKWGSLNNGIEERERLESGYVYEFKRVLECSVFHKNFQTTVHINYTATITTLEKDSSKICSCSSNLEIKCSQNLVDFPRFERARVVGVKNKNYWHKQEQYNYDDETNVKETINLNAEGIIFRVLHVSKQLITSLGLKAFYPLKFSSILANYNLIGNSVHERALVGQGKSLRELQLGACGLRLLPERLLSGLVLLERLYMWANNISYFPVGFFKEASNLKELFLWGNQIEELESHTLAGLWNLKRLELDKNMISKLDKKHFRHLIALEVLNLSHNRIHTLYGNTFSFMTHLKVLGLEYNHIVFMYSEAFTNLNNLMFLNLDANQINFMPDHLFTHLHNLTTLTLSHNLLDQLKINTFSGLHTLQELRLSSNNLSILPEKLFKTCSKLRILLLDRNRLSFLSKSTFPKKLQFKLLSVLSNPLECDCKSQWLRNVCVQKRTNVSNVSSQRPRTKHHHFHLPSVAATCFNKESPDPLDPIIHNVCFLRKQNCQQQRKNKQLQHLLHQPDQLDEYFTPKTVY